MTWGTPEERAEELVNMFLDDRLQASNDPPGLREAIIDRVSRRVDDYGKRGREQVSQLRSAWSRRVPNAYLADEEGTENEFQMAAAGIRTAMALEGVLSDPRKFEHRLTQRMAPSAQWSLRSEASRVPRPPTRASVLDWSLAPIPWLDNEANWPPAGAVTLDGVRQLTEAKGQPPRVAEKPYVGWVQLGMFERQVTLDTRYPATPSREVIIATGLEAGNEPPPANSLPFCSSPPTAWAVAYDPRAAGLDAEQARAALATSQRPLAAITDYKRQPGAPTRHCGTGLQPSSLVPSLEVIALFTLRPETPALRHVLIDDNGPALVGRQWYGFLIGEDTPLEPAVHGTDLLLRPDLYEILENTVGKDRMSLGITVTHSERRPSPDEPDNDD